MRQNHFCVFRLTVQRVSVWHCQMYIAVAVNSSLGAFAYRLNYTQKCRCRANGILPATITRRRSRSTDWATTASTSPNGAALRPSRPVRRHQLVFQPPMMLPGHRRLVRDGARRRPSERPAFFVASTTTPSSATFTSSKLRVSRIRGMFILAYPTSRYCNLQ